MTAEDGDSAVEGVLLALADPTRRRILSALAAGGPATATTLADGLPVTRQAVTKHLALLDRVGLVSVHRVGREVRYEARPRPLDDTARWMASLAAQWERRLHAIKRLAEQGPGAEEGPAAGEKSGPADA
jgi:DNA-binding transcriptional ArsR family regulator